MKEQFFESIESGTFSFYKNEERRNLNNLKSIRVLGQFLLPLY